MTLFVRIFVIPHSCSSETGKLIHTQTHTHTIETVENDRSFSQLCVLMSSAKSILKFHISKKLAYGILLLMSWIGYRKKKRHHLFFIHKDIIKSFGPYHVLILDKYNLRLAKHFTPSHYLFNLKKVTLTASIWIKKNKE